jgi:cell division septation protein DedD
MEEQTSWKGHTFTLLVFTGIVVLCSIFFVLGILVGRTQSQKIAANAPVPAAIEAEAKATHEDKPDFTFYDAVKKQDSAALQPPPVIPEAVDPEPDSKPETLSKPAPNVLNYQISALRKSSDAEKLVNQLKKKGFRAFILMPNSGDRNSLYRVQVGPLADPVEAQEVKKKLEKAGYRPIVKR